MFLFKKILIPGAAIATISGGALYVMGGEDANALDSALLGSIYDSTDSLRRVSLKSSLDDNISSSRRPHIYSLFALNLRTFTDSFRDHLYRLFLYRWAEDFMGREGAQDFQSERAALYGELNRTKLAYVRPTGLDAHSWTSLNNSIFMGKDAIESKFLKVFLGQLYLKKNGSGSGDTYEFSSDDSGLKDKEYAKGISEFQKFIFQKWVAWEHPRLVCQKDWSYSDKFDKESKWKDFESRGNSPSYAFPDFSERKDEIENWVKNFKNNNFCEKNVSILTVSDLPQVSDGFKLSAILYANVNETNNSNNSNNPDTKVNGEELDVNNWKTEVDLIDLFVGPKDAQARSRRAAETTSGGDFELNDELIAGKSKGYNMRKLKSNDKKAFLVRTKSGASFIHTYYTGNKITSGFHTEYQGENLGHEIKDMLLEKLRQFLKSRFDEIIGSYAKDKSDDMAKYFPGFSMGPHTMLYQKIFEYREALFKGQYWLKLNSALWSSTTEFAGARWTKKGDKKVLDRDEGLIVPINFSSKVSNEKLQNTPSQLADIKGDTAVGSFKNLLSPFFPNHQLDSVYTKAKDLKKEIKKSLEKLSIVRAGPGRGSYFFNDYLFDNIFFDFHRDPQRLSRMVRNVFIANELDYIPFKTANTSGIFPKLTKWKNEIHAGILESYVANLYFGERLSDRLVYGGYPRNYKTDFNQKKICYLYLDAGNPTPQAKGDDVDCKDHYEHGESQMKSFLFKYWLKRTFSFNDYGYELGSDEMTEFLSFLYTVNWMISGGNFGNLRQLLSSLIPSGTYATLVWADRVENVENGANRPEIGKVKRDTTKNTDDFDQPHLYFQGFRSDEIFGPLFTRDSTLANQADEYPLSSGHEYAYFRAEENRFLRFSGFQGIATPAYQGNLSQELFDLIFKKFRDANPSGNRNYSGNSGGNSPADDITLGLGYGLNANGQTLEKFLSGIGTMSTLDALMQHFFSFKDSEYKKWKDSQGKPTLQAARDKVKELITEDNFQKITGRFSGPLQNPNSHDTVRPQQKYFIPDSGDSSKITGSIVFVAQINKHDLDGGFDGLLSELSAMTVLRMALIMARDKSIRERVNLDMFLRNNLYF